ncbi:hypothetical protein GCM10009540_45060 [Streptomyces turgidiscabies]
MQRHRGLTGRRDPSYGERFALSTALVVVSLLWTTQEMAPWATILCGAGTAGGVLGLLYFGWRWLSLRRDSH